MTADGGMDMDEHQLIERLGAVGADAPPMRLPLDAPLAAGRRARRRRTVARFAASGTGLTVAAAVALVVANAGGASQFVESPGDPAAAPAAAATPGPITPAPMTPEQWKQRAIDEQRSELKILARHLGADWRYADGEVALRPGTPTARALPDGFWTFAAMNGGGWSADDGFCGAAAPAGLCEEQTLSGGGSVWVQREEHAADAKEPDLGRIVRVLYEQPDGDRVMAEVHALEPVDGSTPARQARASAWLDDLVPSLAAAVTDPDLLPDSQAERDAPLKAMREAEEREAVARGEVTQTTATRALLAELGSDWRLDGEQVVLRPASPSALALPDGYAARTQVIASPHGRNQGSTVKDLCVGTPYEKGMTVDPCVERTLPDGSTAYVQWSRWAPTPKDVRPNIGVGLRVIYVQPDGDEVWLDLSAGQSAGTATGATQAAARAWLEERVDALVAAASSPDV